MRSTTNTLHALVIGVSIWAVLACTSKAVAEASAEAGTATNSRAAAKPEAAAASERRSIATAKTDSNADTQRAAEPDSPAKLAATGTNPILPPMWAGQWHGQLTVDVSELAHTRALESIIESSVDDIGEVRGLGASEVPIAFRGIERLSRPPANVESKLTKPELTTNVDSAMAPVVMGIAAHLVRKLGEAKAALAKRPLIRPDVRALAGHFGPQQQTIYEVATPFDFDEAKHDALMSVIVLLDRDHTVKDAPLPAMAEGVRYEVRCLVDLENDGIDEIIVDEHWMEGLYTKFLRWDARTRKYVAITLTGDAA